MYHAKFNTTGGIFSLFLFPSFFFVCRRFPRARYALPVVAQSLIATLPEATFCQGNPSNDPRERSTEDVIGKSWSRKFASTNNKRDRQRRYVSDAQTRATGYTNHYVPSEATSGLIMRSRKPNQQNILYEPLNKQYICSSTVSENTQI